MTRLLGMAFVGWTALLLCGCGGSSDSAATSTSSASPPATAGVSAVQLSAASLAFGNDLAGTSSPSQTITISDSGTAALIISSVALSGTDAASFSLANGCGATLAAGAACSVAITFSPATSGAKSATLAIATNATSNPAVALSGTGVTAIASVNTTALAFGSQALGTNSAPQTIAVSNTGTAALTIRSLALSGEATSFSLADGCGDTLAVGASCTVAITFAPVTAGAISATLMLETSATSATTVALSGNGTDPLASASASSLVFPSTTVGTVSAPQSIAISNTGTTALSVGNISLSGANAAMFAATSTCSAPIAPAGSCTVSFIFNPTASGSPSAVAQITTNAATNPSIALSATAVQPTPLSFAPYAASDGRVIMDIGVTALNPRNTWESLPTGFALGQVAGATAGTLSDTLGFTPNSGGYIENSAAFANVASSQATIYMRLQRAALAADNSADVGVTFYDSTGNTTGGTASASAAAFTVFDGTNNLIEWAMSAQPASGPLILDAGNWQYPGARYGNSHSSPNLDPTYEDIVLTWQGTTYWVYFDGTPAAYGAFPTALPATGQFSQIAIGGYLNGAGNVGHPLGPYTIQRFQISTAFTPPPPLTGEPLIAFYGDSFVVQGGGVTGDIAGISGSPTVAQVNAVQAQLDQTTSPGATNGTIGQDGFISRAEAYALKQYGGYLQFYTAAESGHGWAYTGMGGTSAANTPAIDDFALGKTGYSDALNAAQPAYIFAFGSVNDVNNGVPADIVGDTKTHFDYWANQNPNLKGIFYVETLSWELATGACTSRGGPAGWKAEMARQRGLLRAAFGAGYMAGTRQVPVTYITTYETWVEGSNSARFLIASNPDNQSQSSNIGSNPNGHPDAEGNIQMVDAYVWPYLTPLIR